MVDVLYPVNSVNGAPEYSGRMLRQSQSVFLAGATAARPLGARSGVRPGTSLATVTATSTQWTCGPFAGVADVEAAAEAGPYEFAFDAAATGAITAADASNPRTDIIYVKVSDPSEGDGSTVPSVVRGYLAGTAAAVPTVPAAPARSFVVAQINVPKAGGGNPTVTWVAPYAVAAGAPLYVPTKAALDAITGYPYQQAIVYADPLAVYNGLWLRQGSAWEVIASDSGWSNLGLAAGIAAQAGSPAVKRAAKDVGYQGYVKAVNPSTGADTPFVANTSYPLLSSSFPLPTWARPKQAKYIPLAGNSGSSGCRVTVNSDGTMSLEIGAVIPLYVSLDAIKYRVD